MSFLCPHCNFENGASRVWEGMVIRCPVCLRDIALTYDLQLWTNKASNSYDGYATSFREFCNLLQDKGAMQTSKPVIEKLLDCSIELLGDRFVLKRQGAFIPLEVAHILIQFDPVKQREFYNTRMYIYR
jgi:hypothetical protein